MEWLIANLSSAARYATYQGKRYLVAPLSLIVPGVLNGSQGPLYYPLDEIKKGYEAWQDVPIVVYHPQVNGTPVSANNPEVLAKQQIGMVRRPSVNGKLVAEGWFDAEKTAKVDNRVLRSLLLGQPMELSTGLYVESEPAENGAHYQGRGYTYIARNYRPDHLAILPDQVGACSLADGCGVCVNQDRLMWLVNTFREDNNLETLTKISGIAEMRMVLDRLSGEIT